MSRFVEQSHEIIYGPGFLFNGSDEYTAEALYKIIEASGRTCYKSRAGNDPRKFTQALINNNHTSVLEHAPLFYKKNNFFNSYQYSVMNLRKALELNVFKDLDELESIIGIDMSWDDFLKKCPLGDQLMSVRFITDRAIANTLVRHRNMSFSQESTMYCNYTNDKKFESGIGFILPSAISMNTKEDEVSEFKNFCNNCETKYFEMIKNGYKAEMARAVLPLCTKTELVMTGPVKDWIWVFMCRAFDMTGRDHPDIKHLIRPLVVKCINIWISKYKFKDKIQDLIKYWCNLKNLDSSIFWKRYYEYISNMNSDNI